jgi:hypothetical protein
MGRQKGQPLVEALLAGAILALLVTIVLALAGVPGELLAQGVAAAFGLAAAFELVSRRAFWAQATGAIITALVATVIILSWPDWTAFVRGSLPEDEQPSVAESIRRAAPPARDVRMPASARDDRTATGAGGDRQRPAGPRPAARTDRQPEAAQPTAAPDPEPDPAPLPTFLVIRNGVDIPVDVGLAAPGMVIDPSPLGSGAEMALRIRRADPAQARIIWRYEGEERSVSWAIAAAGGGPFVIRRD